ncbi:MAG TPA: hypothetical protein VMM13_11415 [Euzebya sp.]|nr:hypothetical protein [Euzebya sp.]
MMDAAMLMGMGLVMLVWRPCRHREGRAPRAAVAMLLLSAAAVWLGSFGLVVGLVAESAGWGGGLVAACGAVWSAVLAGGLGWWQSGLLVAWIVALPARGLWRAGRDLAAAHRLLRQLRPVATGLVGRQHTASQGPVRLRRAGLVVPGLTTPALTLGLLRPVVVVDAAFWAGAEPSERSVVLAHEEAHRRGHHGLVETLAGLLSAGLAPLPAAGETYDCVRRHLEAIADDAAVRAHTPRLVGVTVGRVALGAVPAEGLGASGNATWRVQRLVAPSPNVSWHDRAILGTFALTMALGLLVVAADTAAALTPLLTPRFCAI